MKRQIVLDTETTGLDPTRGHRIIEIGCVELIDRRLTHRTLQLYINPEREVDKGAVEVHGITNDFLKDKPLFADVADEFLDFIRDSELIIHNAPFDVSFIDHELKLLGPHYGRTVNYATVIDTLTMARQKHPGQKNNLDALCKRYNINNTHRQYHGALLDSEILANLYLAMTRGQDCLLSENADSSSFSNTTVSIQKQPTAILRDYKLLNASEAECREHDAIMKAIAKSSGQKLWE